MNAPAGTGFDTARHCALHPDAAIRPERFGALLYHFGNRRLTFLKSPQLCRLLEDLDSHETVEAALAAHRVDARRRPAFLRALSQLEASEVIRAG